MPFETEPIAVVVIVEKLGDINALFAKKHTQAQQTVRQNTKKDVILMENLYTY